MIRIDAVLFAIALPAFGACDRSAPSAEATGYGEPIGVTMTASDSVPQFEIALAASPGVDIEPLVPPLAGMLHGAVKGCAGFVAASLSGGVTQLAFSVEQGKIVGAGVSGEHPDPCLPSRLNGQAVTLPGSQAPLRVLAQIRFSNAAPSGSAEAP
jgi:hypothetical protein